MGRCAFVHVRRRRRPRRSKPLGQTCPQLPAVCIVVQGSVAPRQRPAHSLLAVHARHTARPAGTIGGAQPQHREGGSIFAVAVVVRVRRKTSSGPGSARLSLSLQSFTPQISAGWPSIRRPKSKKAAEREDGVQTRAVVQASSSLQSLSVEQGSRLHAAQLARIADLVAGTQRVLARVDAARASKLSTVHRCRRRISVVTQRPTATIGDAQGLDAAVGRQLGHARTAIAFPRSAGFLAWGRASARRARTRVAARRPVHDSVARSLSIPSPQSLLSVGVAAASVESDPRRY